MNLSIIIKFLFIFSVSILLFSVLSFNFLFYSFSSFLIVVIVDVVGVAARPSLILHAFTVLPKNMAFKRDFSEVTEQLHSMNSRGQWLVTFLVVVHTAATSRL